MRALPLVPLRVVSGALKMLPVLCRALARVPADFVRCALDRGTERASSSSLESEGVGPATGGILSLF